MKNSILLFMFLLFAGTLSAQIKKPGFTVGGSLFYAGPKGDFKNAYRGGVGGEIKGGVGLGKTYVVASVGYAGFAAQSSNKEGTLIYQPVKLGIKQYFLAKRIFVNADAGVATLKNNAMSEAEKKFAGDIGAGVRLAGMEAGIFYDNWKSATGSGATSVVEFKVGYNFTF